MPDPLDVKDTRIPKSQFRNVDMSETIFDGVNLSSCTFKNVNLGKCSFHDISFGNTVITGSCFEGCEIPHGNIGGLKIAGIPVDDLLKAYKKVHGELPEPPHQDRASWSHHWAAIRQPTTASPEPPPTAR